jgi:hypothetical protein
MIRVRNNEIENMTLDSPKGDNLTDASIKNPDFYTYYNTNLYRRRINAIVGAPFPQWTLPERTL